MPKPEAPLFTLDLIYSQGTRQWLMVAPLLGADHLPLGPETTIVLTRSLCARKIAHLAMIGGGKLDVSTQRFSTPSMHGFPLPLGTLRFLKRSDTGLWYNQPEMGLPAHLPAILFDPDEPPPTKLYYCARLRGFHEPSFVA